MITAVNVLWRNSFIGNNNFDFWSGDLIDSWEQDQGSGEISQFDLPDGTAVRISCSTELSNKPSLIQRVDGLDAGKTYQVVLRYKGNILVKNGMNELFSDNTDEWATCQFDLSGTSRLNLVLTMNNNPDYLAYGYIDYIDLSEILSLPLDVSKIRNHEDFERQIEEDLFDFTADSLSLTVKNYTREGYFPPQTWLDHPDKVYRLDITFDYEGINRNMILFYFPARDNAWQEEDYLSDRITVNCYELQSLFKEYGWFLGKLVQPEPEPNSEEVPKVKYVFNTAGDKSVFAILEMMIEQVRKLLVAYSIPVHAEELFCNTPTLSLTTITGMLGLSNITDYLFIPESAANGELVPDEQRGRLFLTTLKSQKVQLWEVKNGIDLYLIDEQFNYGRYTWKFVHNYRSYPALEDNDLYPRAIIVYAFYENLEYLPGDPDPIESYRFRIYSYSYDFDNNHEPHFNSADHSWLNKDQHNYKPEKAYRKDSGLGIPTIYNDFFGSLKNNLTLMAQYPVLPSAAVPASNFLLANEPEGDNYIFETHLESQDLGLGFAAYYEVAAPCQCRYFLYKFPHHFSQKFESITFSGLLREICLTQDSVWYFDYDNHNLAITFADRRLDSEIRELSGTVLSRETGVKPLRFNDLESKIFEANKERMISYIRYFNQRYGLGLRTKQVIIKRFVDVNMAGTYHYQAAFWIVTGYRYRREISEENISRRTIISLFEAVQ